MPLTTTDEKGFVRVIPFSVCIVGCMYFAELRFCPLTPAQVRKEQDGLVHQADCSFLLECGWVGGGLLGGGVFLKRKGAKGETSDLETLPCFAGRFSHVSFVEL